MPLGCSAADDLLPLWSASFRHLVLMAAQRHEARFAPASAEQSGRFVMANAGFSSSQPVLIGFSEKPLHGLDPLLL